MTPNIQLHRASTAAFGACRRPVNWVFGVKEGAAVYCE
jgi:hypothetical protein